jgi:hypothetical protein
LNSSTVANGSADHGRKRFSVNFVSPGKVGAGQRASLQIGLVEIGPCASRNRACVRDFGVNRNKQARASEALGRPGEAAAYIVGGLIAGLGLPTRLRDVGVRSDQLGEIAAKSMHDRWIHTNPRRIDGPAVIRELLDSALGVARKRRSGRLC